MVVLPFANVGGGAEQEHFVDGVTESLTTDLLRIRGAFAIGRNTAFTYKGKPVDLKQIGRELNVRYVLEGSVQRGANRMRVNVQLIAAKARHAEQAANPTSMDLYFQGRAWLNKGLSPDNVARARGLVDRALSADPNNVDALVGSGRADALAGTILCHKRCVALAVSRSWETGAAGMKPERVLDTAHHEGISTGLSHFRRPRSASAGDCGLPVSL